jgi:hypothetical protein
MTDADLLFKWLSGTGLTLTQQFTLVGKGYLRHKPTTTVIELTDKGKNEQLKPRRLFRFKGQPPTDTEILTAVQGGIVHIESELGVHFLGNGMVKQNTITSELEITDRGKSTLFEQYSIVEVRGIYGSQIHLL